MYPLLCNLQHTVISSLVLIKYFHNEESCKVQNANFFVFIHEVGSALRHDSKCTSCKMKETKYIFYYFSDVYQSVSQSFETVEDHSEGDEEDFAKKYQSYSNSGISTYSDKLQEECCDSRAAVQTQGGNVISCRHLHNLPPVSETMVILASNWSTHNNTCL